MHFSIIHPSPAHRTRVRQRIYAKAAVNGNVSDSCLISDPNQAGNRARLLYYLKEKTTIGLEYEQFCAYFKHNEFISLAMAPVDPAIAELAVCVAKSSYSRRFKAKNVVSDDSLSFFASLLAAPDPIRGASLVISANLVDQSRGVGSRLLTNGLAHIQQTHTSESLARLLAH
jgi:hypothetical protein